MKEFTKEFKFHRLSKMYFSVSDSNTHDVNPYSDLSTFLHSKVKTLQWGNNKKASKERFCKNFTQVLTLYNISLPEQYILKTLDKGELKNKEVVLEWVNVAEFHE